MIRWIDDINGVDSEALYGEIQDIRKKIRWIKREAESAANATMLKSLYGRLNDLLLLNEYLLVIVESDKDYVRACKGFRFNGREFKRLVSTSNGVKMSVIVFAAVEGVGGVPMLEELKRRMENGRDMTQKFVPAKLEAYRSLACSASIPVSDPRGVLVVPDVMTHFKADYISLTDNPDGEGEPIYEEVYGGDCENNATDGYGIISPDLMEIWSAELMLPKTASGVCVRAPFTKGMLFCMDIQEFASDVAHNYFVKDIWGKEWNILDVDIILTESMLKLTGGYSSWEEFWRNTKENHSGFSVTKVAESTLRESREINYQFSACLECSDEDVNALVSPTIDDLAGVCGGDVGKMAIYLCGEGMTEDSVRKMPDDWVKALLIDKRVRNDPYVRQKIQQLLRRRFTKAKLGRLRTRGDFQIVGCDPYILLQSVFGLKPTGLLKAGEVYTKYWIDRGADEVVLMRAPMTILNNLCKRKVSYSDEAQHWYKYLPNILLINAWDLTAACENGADYDGDIMLTTDNDVYLRNIDNPMAIICGQRASDKVLVTEEDVVKSNILSFGDSIGVVTNRATSMYDVRSQYPVNSDEYKELSKRLAMCQHFQQACIDRAKGIIAAPMPTYFYREKEANKRSQLDANVCVSRKPWFMTFRYKDIAGEFSKYQKKVNIDCRVQFGCTLEELLDKTKLTDEESAFIQWYKRNSPVSLGDCTSNKIARKVERSLKTITNIWREAGEGFNYGMYRTANKSGNTEAYLKIAKIITWYENVLKEMPGFIKANKLNDAAIAEYRSAIANEVMVECYCNCSSADELASIVLDLTYGGNHNYQIAWDICGDVIIRNLLKKNNYQISYYTQAEDGELEYKGAHYTHHYAKITEEELNDRIE